MTKCINCGGSFRIKRVIYDGVITKSTCPKCLRKVIVDISDLTCFNNKNGEEDCDEGCNTVINTNCVFDFKVI